MKPLTKRQLAILTCIVEHVEARGYPPTIREIGEHVGLTSTSSVHWQLGVLEGAGYLARAPHSPRAIAVQIPEPAA